MEKNILIEEQDEVLRLIDQKELDEIEASAEEFDGFTGIRIVGQVQPEVKVNFTDTEPNFTKTLWVDHIKGQNIADGDLEYKYVINASVTDGNKNKEFIKIAFKISAAKEIAQMLIDSI